MNETNLLIESNFATSTEVLQEESSGEKNWFIEGIFMQSDVINRNRRRYPDEIMEREVNRYITEYVKEKRAIGELNHPVGSPLPNPANASHLIEKMWKDGNNYFGRARVLNTTVGANVKALLEGGVRLGVSSRGIGSVKKDKMGINEVQEDFRLNCVDIVFHPSAPDAMVTGLMEGAEFIWNTTEEDKELVESIKHQFEKDYSRDKEAAILEAFSKLARKLTT